MATETTEEGHPLFLTDDEDDHPLVSQIQVTRMENGQQVYAPRMRQAAELQSLDQISAEFGGGIYVLVARHAGRIVTSRKYVIPGKPKPMYDEAESPAESKAVSPTQVINPMQAMMGTGEGGVMGLIMMMMQQMMQSQAQAAANQTQMFIAMMQGNQASSAEDKANQRAELQANIERERQASERTMALMREMMQAKSGGSGEDFTRGVEFMRTFATQQIEMIKSAAKDGGADTDWGALVQTGLEALQGAMALKNMMSPTPEVVQAAAQVVQ